jgi:hypothetical protein
MQRNQPLRAGFAFAAADAVTPDDHEQRVERATVQPSIRCSPSWNLERESEKAEGAHG